MISDVLVEIFSFLDASDVMNCALVCKDWNEEIKKSARTMKKLKIEFFIYRNEIFIGQDLYRRRLRDRILLESNEKSHRKHQNVEIRIYDGSLKQLTSLQNFELTQVKTLYLCFITGETEAIMLSKVMKLLSKMTQLEVMTIVFIGEYKIDSSKTMTVEFPKLKEINATTDRSQPFIEILRHIKAGKLASLSYNANVQLSNAEIDELANYIKSKVQLTNLTITSKVFSELHQQHNLSGIKLKSLIVKDDFSDKKSDIVSKKFRETLISNAQSLTSLSIHSSLISTEARKIIFNRLRQLTSLHISGHLMTDLSRNDISSNLSLKILEVDPQRAIDGLKVILQRAPQLKKLSFKSFTDDIMREVAVLVPKLVELKTNSTEILTGDQRLNELKSLTVNKIYNPEQLVSLLERCPKIESFEYGPYVSEDHDRFINTLLQHKTLKHLQLNFTSEEEAENREAEVFEKLKTDYRNLKSLRLRRFHGKSILFNFPENPREWNVQWREDARFSYF